jgi:endonuclease G, mitochondrial
MAHQKLIAFLENRITHLGLDRQQYADLFAFVERSTSSTKNRDLPPVAVATRRIVTMFGDINPIIPIQQDAFSLAAYPKWEQKFQGIPLNPIFDAIKCVGRIEMGDQAKTYIGTGWFIAENIIVTNRHVATAMHLSSVNTHFKIDVKVELDVNNTKEFPIDKILYPTSFDDTNDLDIAFLRVKSVAAQSPNIIKYTTSFKYKQNSLIATIGYPTSRDASQGDLFADALQNDRSADFKNFSPGFIRSKGSKKNIFEHDCSTVRGNSGSAIIDVHTGETIGLHFGGGVQKNLAITMKAVVEYAKNNNIL